MALTKTVVLKAYGQNVSINNAYIKIDEIKGGKNKIDALFGVYDKQNGNCVKQSVSRFEPVLDGANFIKQAYQHLKTLPEFAGAQDC